jgi:dTDP-4-amino-4,6-dideoxygalactose transaminase
MPTHLNGRVCEMDALEALAARHALTIVEDAAQALGARFGGRAAGTFGAASAISFYPAKVLGCFGDGGAVLVNTPDLDQRVRQLRDHGRGAEGHIVCWGLNSRLDNLQAAFLDYQLTHYPAVIARRRAIASLYQQRLADVAGIVLPPPPDSDPRRFDIYQNYEIEADRRDQLKAFLFDRGVGTLLPWGGTPVHSLRSLGFTQSLPLTDRLFSRVLMLPINMSLADDDVHYVCDQVRSFYGYSY